MSSPFTLLIEKVSMNSQHPQANRAVDKNIMKALTRGDHVAVMNIMFREIMSLRDLVQEYEEADVKNKAVFDIVCAKNKERLTHLKIMAAQIKEDQLEIKELRERLALEKE